VRNFAFLIDRFGHVPNGNRTYYLSRSQPPFFFKMVGALSEEEPACQYGRYLPQLKKEHSFWMAGEARLKPSEAFRRVVKLRDGSILNRYWDDRDDPRDESYREDVTTARESGRPHAEVYRDLRAAAESGWDFSSRWFADGKNLSTVQTTSIVPVDLNSLLYGLELAISEGCAQVKNAGCKKNFASKAERRRIAIDRYLWNESKGHYVDYQWKKGKQIDRLTAATVYPLFIGLATSQQAEKVAQRVSGDLLKKNGIATTTNTSGQQWDLPNGWAPLQWMTIDGLNKYDHGALAREVATRWMTTVNRGYREAGKLLEKYDVTADQSGGGGEYPTQDGFGWTNGVMVKLSTLYPEILRENDSYSRAVPEELQVKRNAKCWRSLAKDRSMTALMTNANF
jgi:alpha,alpha-trehalase